MRSAKIPYTVKPFYKGHLVIADTFCRIGLIMVKLSKKSLNEAGSSLSGRRDSCGGCVVYKHQPVSDLLLS